MDITTYFESDDFLDIISHLGKYCNNRVNDVVDLTKFFISAGIDYWKLFSRDGISLDKMNNFMRNVALEYKKIIEAHGSADRYHYELQNSLYGLYITDLLEKFDISYADLKNEIIENKVKEYIAVQLLSTEYKFHAFNGNFLESIIEHGLDPNSKFEDQAELNMINALFERHGEKLILGWQQLNCNGKVSYADSASESYYYATNSPEWFAQFTGQGFSFNSEGKYSKNAFLRRDYDAASNNLMTLMEKRDFSKDEIDCVMSFFDKYWGLYANDKSKPMLCIIPSENLSFERLYSFVMEDSCVQESLRDFMSCCLSSYTHDGRSEQVIDTQNALYVALPEVSRVLEKMNINNKNNGVKK